MTNGAEYVCFELGGSLFALPRTSLDEIHPLPLLFRPPGSPAALEGVYDVGGELVSAVRLDRLLGLEECDPGLYSHLIRLNEEHSSIALIVEKVVSVGPAGPGGVRPLDVDETFRGCVSGELDRGDTLVHVLAVDRLINASEAQRLSAFHDMEGVRSAIFGDGQ
ncbi:MAG: chemotaxis protein CheW [Rhodospirillales bacterium]